MLSQRATRIFPVSSPTIRFPTLPTVPSLRVNSLTSKAETILAIKLTVLFSSVMSETFTLSPLYSRSPIDGNHTDAFALGKSRQYSPLFLIASQVIFFADNIG